MKNPTISITIPVYNEEEDIVPCLDAISELNYPKNNVEVLLVDGGSTDKTVARAKKYSFVSIVNNPQKDTHVGKMLGLKKSTGKFWVYFDADLKPNG
ncbi:glycosyltransferase, partial [Patescibacteria group bacterium]